jgi:hypothetical protein
MSTVPVYPLRVEGKLEAPLSRWLWLVKWLLLIPHFVVLVFLWIAFFVLSIIAFFAILFTGRYPRSIFDFNVGVLRWSWRVVFYSYGALGTDKYPPFTLEEVPDYPAKLEVIYPERLSQGLVLVKWWLLAIPHYLILGILLGWPWFAWHEGPWRWPWGGGGLIGLLVLFAGVALLFTDSYPRSIFDLVMGLNRWALRFAAYAGLMTDTYPPFRLDMGEAEAGSVTGSELPPTGAPSGETRRGQRVGRILMLIFGSLAVLVGLALAIGGGVITWADQTQRDADGFLMIPAVHLATNSYALVSDRYEIRLEGPDWLYTRDLLGSVRLRSESAQTVFVGIALASEVSGYLGGVEHTVVTDLTEHPKSYVLYPGGPPSAAPAAERFWVASSQGSGQQTLTWRVREGSWQVVIMNADGSRAVDVELAVGARLSGLIWLGVGLLSGAALLLAVGAALIYFGASTRRTT